MHVAQSNVDRPVRGARRRLDHGFSPAGIQDLAGRYGRRATDEAMTTPTATKGDHAIETVAEKLQAFVQDARSSGGVKAKLGDAMADDPAFLRKLKPSLIAARAKGESPTSGPVGIPPAVPSGPQIARPKPPKGSRSGGLNPWAVIGIAAVAGYVLAKAIDWRGHAHPRL
jgi:hypothetical protein